ncbi:MAG: AarF/ABC1/UbiB kinase family protein [Elainellaceae cyanobacterium]
MPPVATVAPTPSSNAPLSSADELERAHQPELPQTRPEMRYDPEAIEAMYNRRPFQVVARLFSTVWPVVAFAIQIIWDRWTGRTSRNEPKRAVRARQILTNLGPAYIKVGQALSTRPDLVSPVYLEELSQLQDKLPPFPNKLAFQFIEEELGDRPENIYAELTDSPIAAASLGQVYRGRLKSGEEVAVKVQRPGLYQRIALDIYILRQVSKLITRFIPQLKSDLVAIMDEFGARIFEEMDYVQEGLNADRFRDLYGHLEDIYVPQIYWDYTDRRVLTMEWITGTKLTDLDAVVEKGIDARYLIEVGVQCSLRQLLEHGFFHADPHPGNLLATPDGKLAYLDFGMMSQVKPYQRYGLLEAVVHLVNRDFDGLANDYIKLEFLTPDTDLTPIIPALANVFGNALGASVAELNFKSITDQLSALMYEYPFRVPAYYALIIRSLVTLEGIAIKIDPEFKVLSKAYPYVAKRLLSDPSPQLRASLQDLLFKDSGFRWNRLENLLRNAKDSPDYDLAQILHQTVNFIFSPRGEFIRVHLVDAVVQSIDSFGRNTVQQAVFSIRDQFGLKTKPLTTPAQSETLDHILRIANILRETPGFGPGLVAELVPHVLSQPEFRHMGRSVAGELSQRIAARMIRELLLQTETNPNGHYLRRALPAAKVS